MTSVTFNPNLESSITYSPSDEPSKIRFRINTTLRESHQFLELEDVLNREYPHSLKEEKTDFSANHYETDIPDYLAKVEKYFKGYASYGENYANPPKNNCCIYITELKTCLRCYTECRKQLSVYYANIENNSDKPNFNYEFRTKKTLNSWLFRINSSIKILNQMTHNTRLYSAILTGLEIGTSAVSIKMLNKAATTIQRVFKGHLTRKSEAATTIQRAFKEHLTRKAIDQKKIDANRTKIIINAGVVATLSCAAYFLSSQKNLDWLLTNTGLREE